MNKKYLYWLDSENSKEETVAREMYSRIGYVFHIVQMIEYNVANILSIEKTIDAKKDTYTAEEFEIAKNKISNKYKLLTKETFGSLAKEAQNSPSLKNLIPTINRIVTKRNDIAHNCFKTKAFTSEHINIEDMEAFIKELNDYECDVYNLNEKVLKIFKRFKTKI